MAMIQYVNKTILTTMISNTFKKEKSTCKYPRTRGNKQASQIADLSVIVKTKWTKIFAMFYSIHTHKHKLNLEAEIV